MDKIRTTSGQAKPTKEARFELRLTEHEKIAWREIMFQDGFDTLSVWIRNLVNARCRTLNRREL